VHESGEMLECGILHVPAAKHDPQGYGSALTYARRYSLMAACGIAPEDDDGNAVTHVVQSSEATIKAILADIAECKTHDELKEAFYNGIRETGNNSVAREQITKAKDEQKATLKGTP